ncbi:MAG: Lrp/AsnC family transcriptional regulator [Candidatus Latescibacterota bacterium]
MQNIDDIDKKILQILQVQGDIANAELARQMSLSPSACLTRTRQLCGKGIIRSITANIEYALVGLEIQTYTFVNLSPHNRKTARAFVEKVKDIPQIIECYNITGRWDYMLKIVAPTIASYRDFVIDCLIEMPGVHTVESSIILKTEKQNGIIPLT